MNFLYKLSKYLQKNKGLERILHEFDDINIRPCLGVEIEFYITPAVDIEHLSKIIGYEIKKERGKGQYEIAMSPTVNILDYIVEIHNLIKDLTNEVKNLSAEINLASKPFADDYGNALQCHLSFINTTNMQFVEDTAFIDHVARSLCHFMLESFIIFFPEEKDYLRIDDRFMAPTHVAFGGNNRSVAVRIPDYKPLRVEHRLASISTDIYLALFALLKSIILGIKKPNIINNIPKIYGNAYDNQYNLTALPNNITSARKLFNPDFFLG